MHGLSALIEKTPINKRIAMEAYDKDRINQIKKRLAEATPGPWYANYLDDSFHMNLVAVTTRPDTEMHEALPYDDPDNKIRDSIVATTLIQAGLGDEEESPNFVEVDLDDGEGRWHEDAEFIAHSRSDVEYLLELVEALRANLE